VTGFSGSAVTDDACVCGGGTVAEVKPLAESAAAAENRGNEGDVEHRGGGGGAAAACKDASGG